MSRRRTTLIVAAALAAVGIAVGVPWLVTPGGGSAAHGTELVGHQVRLTPSDGAATGRLAAGEQAFALQLLQHTAGSGNVTVAPASLATALAMLENGAAGSTRSELARVLDGADDNAGWRALTADWSRAAAASGSALDTANGTWLQQGFPVKQGYLDALRSYYDSGVWTVDFTGHGAAALAAIDAWTRQQTHGKITKLFDRLDPATVLVLADAEYFEAEWATRFDPSKTRDAAFVRADGRTVTAPFMSDSETRYPSAVTPDYAAVQLPYQGGRFAALAIMPTRESLSSFVAGLTPDRLASLVSGLRPMAVDLQLPKFTVRSTVDLGRTLADMGMPTAFTAAADFSAMTPEPVSVSQVLQRTYLAVSEKGTEAAAVTGIGLSMSAAAGPPLQVRLDHPFLFLVRDTRTGAILFASSVQDPTAG